MLKPEPELKRWFVDCAAGLALCVVTHVLTHQCFHAEAGKISAGLAIGSGAVWVMSAHLPRRRRGLAAEFNFVAACLAAMSAICLLP